MILYDPRRPSEDAHEPILQEFFLRSTAKDPVPKFHANTRVAILLIMTYTQFHDALSWQEGYSDVSLYEFPHCALYSYYLSDSQRVANATNTSKAAPAFTSESAMPVAAPSKKHKKKLMHANGSSSPPPCPAKKRARTVVS